MQRHGPIVPVQFSLSKLCRSIPLGQTAVLAVKLSLLLSGLGYPGMGRQTRAELGSTALLTRY
jgi:hypothetical protein